MEHSKLWRPKVELCQPLIKDGSVNSDEIRGMSFKFENVSPFKWKDRFLLLHTFVTHVAAENGYHGDNASITSGKYQRIRAHLREINTKIVQGESADLAEVIFSHDSEKNNEKDGEKQDDDTWTVKAINWSAE